MCPLDVSQLFLNHNTSILNHDTITIDDYLPIISHYSTIIITCTPIDANMYLTHSSSFISHFVLPATLRYTYLELFVLKSTNLCPPVILENTPHPSTMLAII